MTQKQRILKYLEDHGSITTLEAFRYLGITKLSNRISELIRDGEKIEKDTESCRNRYGETTYYTRYRRAV
ncbi:MAG: hypothetical protein J6P40_07305 [Oscillospiraceae bacterium]|nr:hypothetical protein [Oscillospiraceae bacterium]